MATLKQIQEALDQTNGAQFLYQPVIDRALFEDKRAFTITRMLFPRRTWNTPKYSFVKRSDYPRTRSVKEVPATSGTGSVSATSSDYSQVEYNVKHWQSQIDVSKFSVQTARLTGDLMAQELDGASQNAAWFEETLNFFGSSGATLNGHRPEWDGVDLLMSTSNKFIANDTSSFALLDQMYDAVKRRKAASPGSDYAFVMSSEMLSAISRQFVQYQRWMDKMTVYPRDDRGRLGGTVFDNKNYIDAGLEVSTYRGVPLLETSFLTSVGQMGTVTASATGSDGSITAADYKYVVEAVSDMGVSLASAEASVTVSSTNHVALSWSTPTITDDEGNSRDILLYRIFRTDANGAANSETLYAVISAVNNSDSAVTSWTDKGTILDPTSDNTLYAVTVASSSSEAVPDAVTTPRFSSNYQDIWLLPRDPDVLCVPVVNEMTTTQLALINARSQQVALTGDQVLAVRGPRFLAKACSVLLS